MTFKLTNSIIDQRLFDRSIKRVDDYINMITKITFKCEKCNYCWKTRPATIITNKSGCPNCCNKVPVTNQNIDFRLINKNIKRLDSFYNSKTSLRFECLICNYIWLTYPDNIINGGRGCPKCAGKAKLTNEIVDNKLTNRTIKRIDNYINSQTKINFKCLVCEFMWKATPSSIIHSENGCPQCKFGKNEKIIRSTLIKYNINFESHKSINNIVVGKFRNLIVDFYIPKSNLIIEYNGAQHYKPVQFGNMNLSTAEDRFIKQKERDIYLSNFCKINNINLLWIDGRNFINSKLIKYVEDSIIPLLQGISNE